MIDLYYWPTPNGHKVALFLEEAELAYRLVPINIGKGEQFAPDFLAVSPNNKIPAIVDHEPKSGRGPLNVFESGAILLYLAEKTGRFLPPSSPSREKVLEWLFWQVGGLGPMAGQNHHLNRYAPEKVPYAIERYVNETRRLYRVLDQNLAKYPYVGSADYSIADMAIYPWIVPHDMQGMDLNEFPSLKRWYEGVKSRPSTVRAYEKGERISKPGAPLSEEARRVLFGQK